MSSEENTVLYEKKGSIAILTLNRPQRLNALNAQMQMDLKASLKKAKEDPDIRSIILTGAGRGFCAGSDVSEFASKFLPEDGITPYDFIEVLKPIIAAVNGVAVGFGMNVTLNCDIIIASEEATFGEFFIRMGLVPDMNGSLWLPMMLGPHKAKELIFTGERITAQEALRIGLVNKVVPADQLMPTAMELATLLAELPPLAMQMSKKLLHDGFRKIFDEIRTKEVQYQSEMFATKDHMEAVMAFLQKRKPVFKGK